MCYHHWVNIVSAKPHRIQLIPCLAKIRIHSCVYWNELFFLSFSLDASVQSWMSSGFLNRIPQDSQTPRVVCHFSSLAEPLSSCSRLGCLFSRPSQSSWDFSSFPMEFFLCLSSVEWEFLGPVSFSFRWIVCPSGFLRKSSSERDCFETWPVWKCLFFPHTWMTVCLGTTF